MAKTKRVYGEYKCKICNKLFSEKAGLAQHVQLHTDARPFACRLCTYTGKTKKYLARHAARVHRQPTAHHCRVCDKMFHYKCNLVKHMYAHTNERPFKCEVCNKGFNSTYSLSSHRHVHTGAKPYKCSYCEYACRDNSTLRKHQERHAGVTRVFQCTQCDKTYKTKRILKTHVAEVHLKRDVKTMPCPHCDKMFKSVKLLNNHVRQTHLRLYACQCEICGVTLASKYNMTTHLTSHIDYRPFACSFAGCDKRYKDKAALKKHAIVHYPERQFPCDVCHRTFTRPHRLLAHRKQHAPKRKTAFCDYCGKGFYNKNYVRSHITRKHMYRQHYICDICGLLTYNKPSIVMHLKYGHVSEMDRKCKICKKTYKKHIYLKSHYWNTHSVRYKLNYRRSRGRKLKIVSNETNEESNNIALQHEIKVEHLSESEETTELSLPEANGGSTAEAVKFTDFIERIIMPTVGDEDVFGKEAGIYVDVTSQREADRVRSEMMRRWRQNGGTKPMKRLERHYNSVLKKRDFSKVVNEKIEITVFSETESTVPISEYKKTFNTKENTNDSIVETSNSIKDSEHSKNNHLSSVTDEHLNGDIEKIKNDDVNSVTNETDIEISEHDTETGKNGVIGDENQHLSENYMHDDKYDKESCTNNASIRDELSKAAEGSYENDENTREFTEIISSENIGYENSLAELVKVRKRKCVRNIKDINYIDTGDDGESDKMINNEKIPPENDVITGTSNGDIHIGNNKLEIGNKRKPRNTKCKRTPKKKGNIPKSRSSNKSNDALENDQSNSREDKIGATENDVNSTNVAINDLDTHINNIDNLESSITEALDVNIKNKGNSTETNKEVSSPQIDETLENQRNPKEDAINIDNSLEYTATNRPRRSVRNIKKNVNKDFVSHMDDDNDEEDCDDDDEFVPDNDDADDDKDDNDDGDENNKSNKFKINTHQCYVCFKLYETKEKLLNHCKEHFDVCNMKMLKKCPLCDYVTELDLVRHVRITHKINLNYLYGTLKDRKNNNTKSRFYFNVKNDSVDEIEVIPSIKNLNRQASMRIDKKRKEKNDKEVKKTKLVKKAGEWIVEKVLINTKKGNYVLPDEVEESLKNDQNKDKNDGNKDKNDKNTDKNGKNTDKNYKNAGKSCGNRDKNDGNKDKNDRNTDKSDKNTDKNSRNTDKNYKNAGKSCGNRDKNDGNTDKSDENDGKELENEDYCVKMQKLSRIAKKNGQIMLFPCEKCEKICQTFSALKLHIRRHDPNAKPFKKKVWKHKLSEEELRKHQENKEKERNKHFKNKNRYQKPKPIVHKHKCDPKLKDFYEKNIKGGDIEFWQFLKIFNKMSRENVNDFTDLESRPEFGLHYDNSKSNPPQESIDLNKSDLNPHIVAKSGLKPKKNNSKTLDKTKVVKGSFKRKILINKKDYLKRKRMKELLRQKLVDKSNI